MEDIDADFTERKQEGDMIVATSNFGCGSSREHAPLAIKGCGISCVIAHSFARIFFRNAINVGLPIVECPGTAQIANESEGELDLASGTFKADGREFSGAPYPEAMRKLIDAGGLMPYVATKLAAGKQG